MTGRGIRRCGWLGWAAAALLWPVWAAGESLSGGGSLFANEKVYREGDLVTVLVAETASGEQSASTSLNKETSLGVTAGGVLDGVLPAASAGVNDKHKGGGNLAREGKLTATVTARVQKILENGCLSLGGEQEIAFDSGRQRISVQGVARPRDISSANEIYSYRLSDARIEYLGAGALHEKARTGFLGRVLDWLWIF